MAILYNLSFLKLYLTTIYDQHTLNENKSFFIFLSDEVRMFSKINRNIYKPPVLESTKEVVRKNFTREIEFFEFCKQRLHKQYLALNLKDDEL